MSALDSLPIVQGFRCEVCGATVDIATPMSWRCPNSSAVDRHHVLSIVQRTTELRDTGEANPFLGFRSHLAWDSFAAARGLTVSARIALIHELDDLVAAVAGVGFVRTPCLRADRLSDALKFSAIGGVWIKNETDNVAGSQKARHLFTTLLHLITLERLGELTERRPLAIASCGNAALAASTLAAAVSWPVQVFVPPTAHPSYLERFAALGATVVQCPRVATDPPGDPCVFRFREALAAGAIPFAVQGPENAWCLDGGRTIGWEMATAGLDRIFVQTGGGAFASCVGAGLSEGGATTRVYPVQTEGCAPLARAWELAANFGGPGQAGKHWEQLMWPWDTEPHSLADGILDDETYDWLGAFEATVHSGGSPVVAAERDVLAAHFLSESDTQIAASPTGTAGLAGLLAARGDVGDNERVGVIFSGVRR
jgi:threonine synthase